MNRRRASALGLGLCTAIGAVAWSVASRPYHLRVVEEGVLYRSGLLAPAKLEEVLADHGIRTVVNLQPESINALPWHAAERAACEAKGARLVDLPMAADQPATSEQVAAFLAVMDDPRNHPVLVHCQHGVIRTGMMVAVFQVARRGVPAERAYGEMPRFGHDFDRPWRRPVRDFILGLDAASLPPAASVASSTSAATSTRPVAPALTEGSRR